MNMMHNPDKVHDIVCVEATVTITPHVEIGDVKSFRVNDIKIGECCGVSHETCSFKVHQKLCVQIPLEFSATAEAEATGIVCEEAHPGECCDRNNKNDRNDKNDRNYDRNCDRNYDRNCDRNYDRNDSK